MTEPEENSEQELSLNELSAAYAQAMSGDAPADSPDANTEEDTADQAAEAEQPAEEEPDSPPDVSEEDTDVSPRSIVEAMLFVGNRENEPLDTVKAAALMRGVTPGEIPEIVAELNERYTHDGCPYIIVNDEAGYRLTLRKEFDATRNKLYGRAREARLSQAAIDVLAIVAYRQPLTADQVNAVRGQAGGHILSQLVRRQLLRIERSDEKPRETFYHTTDRFLDLFDLSSLDDLPQAEEIEK